MNNLIIVVFVSLSYLAANDSFKIEPKIVGGNVAKLGQFPYFAYLRVYYPDFSGGTCGASLISDEWLLTAAHCLEGAQSVNAILGETRFNQPEPGHLAVFVDKVNFHIHPDYKSETIFNDIALIHLTTKIEPSTQIQPAHLPADCSALKTNNVIAIGHGNANDDGDKSEQLKFAMLRTLPSSACRKAYPIVSNGKFIFCALSEEGNQSVCDGDSGGPLVTEPDRTLVGISSFIGPDGCKTDFPQGFTNLVAHYKWIMEVTGLNLPEC